MHHKGRNRHHFEYWWDYDSATKAVAAVKMPSKWFVEMFCDRVAASKIYRKKDYTDSSPPEYFRRAKHERIIHPETRKELEELLVMLSEKGEKETFRYIRKNKNNF